MTGPTGVWPLSRPRSLGIGNGRELVSPVRAHRPTKGHHYIAELLAFETEQDTKHPK